MDQGQLWELAVCPMHERHLYRQLLRPTVCRPDPPDRLIERGNYPHHCRNHLPCQSGLKRASLSDSGTGCLVGPVDLELECRDYCTHSKQDSVLHVLRTYVLVQI